MEYNIKVQATGGAQIYPCRHVAWVATMRKYTTTIIVRFDSP